MEFSETLTSPQLQIFEIVQAYLNKNPFFVIDDLYVICKKNTKIPENEIYSILNGFIKKKLIVDGSKLTRDNILKNPIRSEIYNFISKNPALNFTQILKKFNLHSYTARWHLEMLKKFGFIRQKKIKIFNVFFTQDFPENKELIVYSLRNPNALKIFLCLQYTPLNSNNLARILNLNYSTIQYHIQELIQHKLIISIGNKFSINSDFTNFLKQFYDLTIPKEVISLCDSLTGGKGKNSSTNDLEFRQNIKNELNALADQIKFLQNHLNNPPNFTRTLDEIENRLLKLEAELRNLSEKVRLEK